MINGFYKIYIDGELQCSSKNIITNGGKTVIKQFLAGNIPSWSGGIAVGPITTAASVSDTKLYFEVDRAATLTKTVDGNGNIVLRASFPLDLQTVINEVGVYPFVSSTNSGRYQDKIITDFSETSWTNGTSDTTSSYVGTKNIILNSSNASSTLSNLSIDISGYAKTDKFELLVNNLDANAKTITLTYKDGTPANDTTVTFPNLSASTGLQVVSIELGATNISTITEITMSSTGASKSISLDSLKFLNTDESGYSTSLVSRSVLGSSITKYAGQDLEIEYYLAGL